MQDVRKVPAKVAFDVEFVAVEEDIMGIAQGLEDALRGRLSVFFRDDKLDEPKIVASSHVEV